MELKYRISFFANISIHVFAILFFIILIGASGHRVNFEGKDYLLFAYPVLMVILISILKWMNVQSNAGVMALRFALSILLFLSLFFASFLLVTLHEDKLDLGFLVFSHTVILIFSASNIILLFGLIRGEI